MSIRIETPAITRLGRYEPPPTLADAPWDSCEVVPQPDGRSYDVIQLGGPEGLAMQTMTPGEALRLLDQLDSLGYVRVDAYVPSTRAVRQAGERKDTDVDRLQRLRGQGGASARTGKAAERVQQGKVRESRWAGTEGSLWGGGVGGHFPPGMGSALGGGGGDGDEAEDRTGLPDDEELEAMVRRAEEAADERLAGASPSPVRPVTGGFPAPAVREPEDAWSGDEPDEEAALPAKAPGIDFEALEAAARQREARATSAPAPVPAQPAAGGGSFMERLAAAKARREAEAAGAAEPESPTPGARAPRR